DDILELSCSGFELKLEETVDVDTLSTLGFPSEVPVAVLTATLVAPKANTADKIANGVINGGVRYAIFLPPIYTFTFLTILLHTSKRIHEFFMMKDRKSTRLNSSHVSI